METDLLTKLGNREVTKVELAQKVESNFNLLPALLEGTSSSKATIRYSCGKVLMDLSEKYPKKLYPYMDFFIQLSRQQVPNFKVECYGNNRKPDQS